MFRESPIDKLRSSLMTRRSLKLVSLNTIREAITNEIVLLAALAFER